MEIDRNFDATAQKYSEAMIEELFGEDIPIQRIGIFSRVGHFFRRIFGTKKSIDTYVPDASSIFRRFYEVLDREDPAYIFVRHAASLCDDALRFAQQRLKASTRLNALNVFADELEAFMNLSDEDVANLKRMLDRFISLAGERSGLLEKLSDFDSALIAMQPLEDDARMAIGSIREAEKFQRVLRMDLGYLAGEKEELIFEREQMQKSLVFIRKLRGWVVGVFSIITVFLGYAVLGPAINVFFPTTVLVLISMAFIVLLGFFSRRVRFEIRQNQRKQQRAVELLNKKSVVYAYYTNFLRFCYKKYSVNNSRKLETNLADLEGYKFLANRIDTVRSLMYETESSIERFVREKRLGAVRTTIEGFAKTINLDNKRRRSIEVNAEKTMLERTLSELDRRHEEAWGNLEKLNEHEQSGKVAQVMDAYIEQAEKLFTPPKDSDAVEERPIWKLFDVLADGTDAQDLSGEASEILENISQNPDSESPEINKGGA